ncbi:MAG TPA: M48 family metalloprotease [Thermoplasmata archaeon]|nr:M48 family metalloprotease [Thermoplasmata archaeon]
MADALVAVLYLPVALWVAVGVVLFIAFRRSASATVFRLAATFLGFWALLATTALVWVVANGGWSAVVRLLHSPSSLFVASALPTWEWGAVGALLVFTLAFLLAQGVARALLVLYRPRPLNWPGGIPVPAAPTSLFVFSTPRVEAFTFTLVELGSRGRPRRRDVIMVSEGLLARLEPREWQAVLAHELGHVRGLDGRYLTFFRTFARMMRWDPVLALLSDRLTVREEFRADLEAVTITKKPRALARALFKVSTEPPFRSTGAAALLGTSGRRARRQAVERIRRLVALAESGQFPEERGE